MKMTNEIEQHAAGKNPLYLEDHVEYLRDVAGQMREAVERKETFNCRPYRWQEELWILDKGVYKPVGLLNIVLTYDIGHNETANQPTVFTALFDKYFRMEPCRDKGGHTVTDWYDHADDSESGDGVFETWGSPGEGLLLLTRRHIQKYFSLRQDVLTKARGMALDDQAIRRLMGAFVPYAQKE